MTNRRTKDAHRSRPPEPPKHDRGLELTLSQLIGVPLLALIPLIAATDAFGERWKRAEGQSARLHVVVEYPDVLRARVSKPMTVVVRNRSAEAFDTLHVEFDPAYVERFASIDFIPNADDAYVIRLTGVQPGETRRVYAQFSADIIGRHRGRVVARVSGDSSAVTVRTTVFP